MTVEAKKLSIEKILNINDEYQRYCGAMNELAERDIDYDWHECLFRVKDFCTELLIKDAFEWDSIKEKLNNGDLSAHDDILNIEDQIGFFLKELIFGYIYNR